MLMLGILYDNLQIWKFFLKKEFIQSFENLKVIWWKRRWGGGCGWVATRKTWQGKTQSGRLHGITSGTGHEASTSPEEQGEWVLHSSLALQVLVAVYTLQKTNTPGNAQLLPYTNTSSIFMIIIAHELICIREMCCRETAWCLTFPRIVYRTTERIS